MRDEHHPRPLTSRANINICCFIFIISEMITFLAFSYCDGIITNKFTITPSITVIFEQREFVTMTEISERFLWQSQYYEIYKSYIDVLHFVSFIEVVVWYQIVVGEAYIVMSLIGCYNNLERSPSYLILIGK